jgi:serine phosphatase RsbU (regulator of sigma subunit)
VRPFGQDGGPLVGVLEGETWTEGQDTIAPGESLILYTDGITEAGMGDRDLYGEARLDQVLHRCSGKSAEELAQNITADVTAYQGDQPSDDVTLVVLKRLA